MRQLLRLSRLALADERGSVFLAGLMLVAIMTLLGATLFDLSNIEDVLTSGDSAGVQSLYCAEAALNRTLNDNAEVAEMIACGAHLVMFSTGRGSVVGSAISPIIKVCANPKTFKRLSDDMDVDAGRILEGRATLDEVGREIYDLVVEVAGGSRKRFAVLLPPPPSGGRSTVRAEVVGDSRLRASVEVAAREENAELVGLLRR